MAGRHEMTREPVRRCGFVAIIGAPNSGKSTLVNALVGAKVSIVTPKVQTTRMRIRGIVTEGDAQLIFVDTPGIFAPRRRLDRAMVAAAWGGAADADIIVLLVDAKSGIDEQTASIIEGLKKAGRKAVAALNKVDIVKRDSLLGLAAGLDAHGIFTDVFMISALTGDGIGDLRKFLAHSVPEGPWHYPEDQLSDINDRLMAAEITREQLFLQLRKEVPYALTVETDRWQELDDGSVRIEQTIYVRRDSQKAIVLGRGGQRIRSVGEAARKELAALLEREVHLFLFVKVREDWPEDPERYAALGLEYGE
jgi:GTP-binding protein Era